MLTVHDIHIADVDRTAAQVICWNLELDGAAAKSKNQWLSKIKLIVSLHTLRQINSLLDFLSKLSKTFNLRWGNTERNAAYYHYHFINRSRSFITGLSLRSSIVSTFEAFPTFLVFKFDAERKTISYTMWTWTFQNRTGIIEFLSFLIRLPTFLINGMRGIQRWWRIYKTI